MGYKDFEAKMRKDMAKVIVERERLGAGMKSKKARRSPRNIEDLPSKEGMKKPYKDHKTLNENLSPLRRYLYKNVNRPWDKVYSEICENLKATSTVQQHVRDHVAQYVKRDVVRKGKKVMHFGHYRRGLVELYNRDLYVDPLTGLLRCYKSKDRIAPRPAADPFLLELTNLIGYGKARFEYRDGKLHKVFQNKDTEEWDVYLKLGVTQARADVRQLPPLAGRRPLEHFFQKYHKKIKGEYLELLAALYATKIAKAAHDQAKEAEARVCGIVLHYLQTDPNCTKTHPPSQKPKYRKNIP